MQSVVLGGKNLSQFHLVHHISHMGWPGLEPASTRWQGSE